MGARSLGKLVLVGRARGQHVCLAQIQPETAFGSPEHLIERGRRAMVSATDDFVGEIERAVVGKGDAKAIRSALRRVARRFPLARVARIIEQELLHGQMLGALDSDLEGEEGKAIAPVAMATRKKGFTRNPLSAAADAFRKREVVTSEIFEAMTAAAKRRSFTVAGLARDAMLTTVKGELARQVEQGAELGSFKSFVRTRLESAGWTPANPSHVETIFRTNVMSAYNQGRYEQMTQPEVVAARPYWQVLTPNDGPPRQRPNHQKTHLAVFRADDPVFPEAFPPWDYNCRCRMRTLSERQAKAYTVHDGGFLTSLELPAPGFGGGGL